MKRPPKARDLADYADMFAAMGAEQRLQIMRLLLSAHPDGMVVGDILAELKIAPSTLSHHLEKLKHEGLVSVRRDTKFLWYSANIDALQSLDHLPVFRVLLTVKRYQARPSHSTLQMTVRRMTIQ